MNERATATNKRQKDAPHSYISWSLHCFRLIPRRYATFIAGESNDFLPRDVMRNATVRNGMSAT